MTDYAPRNRQDLNPLFTDSQLSMSQYASGNDISYLHGNGQIHYSSLSSNYPTYSTPFIPTQTSSCNVMYLPTTSPGAMQYHLQPPPRSATLASQNRVLPGNSYVSSMSHGQQSSQNHSRIAMHSGNPLTETEDQESVNDDTMQSEPIEPPLEGYPKVDDFDDLMKHYVEQLSPKKQDKALIHARRAHNIKIVLMDKKTTSVESAQFRFWVKKMFTLLPLDPSIPPRKRRICHEGKPVAVREKLFKILTRAHQKCQHGGRDKTSAQVRRVYSWIPKELISRFVKICPTCQIRRGPARGSPPSNDKSPQNYHNSLSPDISSPAESRRESIANVQSSALLRSPLRLVGGNSTFQNQNRWMSGLHNVDHPLHNLIPEQHLISEPSISGSSYSSVNHQNGIRNSPSFGVGTFSFNTLISPESRFGIKSESEYKEEPPY